MVWNETFDFSDKSIDVLLVGEILMDIINDPSTGQNTSIIGGSPYNICKNLTKLGIKNRFYGSIGDDEFGRMILEQIQTNKIDAYVSTQKTSTSFVKINRTVSSPVPIFYRKADKLIHLTGRLISDVSHSKILHFTYWPLSVEPGKTTILKLIDEAKANNTLICFDPNYHPLLDDDQLNGLKQIRDIIDKVDIIKPSLDDSERIFGKQAIETYLDIYQELGSKLTIMTLGKDGLIARYKNQTMHLPSLATEVIDSTGAGDAFWSGLYSGITRGKSIRESLTLGLLCSAMNLQSVGADFPLPHYLELFDQLGR